MVPSKLSRTLDYLPPVIAFIAAVGALIGAPKWIVLASGHTKLTALGWAVLTIAIAALISALLITKRNHRIQHEQRALRARIATIGEQQLLRGLERAVCVFRLSSLWDKNHPESESPLDLLSTDRRSILAKLNLNSMSPYADGKGSVKWWRMFEDKAKQGATQITTALQIYVTFLDPDLVETATKLLNSEFLQIHLQCIHDIIDANTHNDPNRPVQFFWIDSEEMHRSGYEEFWQLVTKTIRLCAKTSPGDRVLWSSLREIVVGKHSPMQA